jgi:hypothetical protein
VDALPRILEPEEPSQPVLRGTPGAGRSRTRTTRARKTLRQRPSGRMLAMTLRELQVAVLQYEAKLWAKEIRSARGDLMLLTETMDCSKQHVYNTVRRLNLVEFVNQVRKRHGLRPLLLLEQHRPIVR